MNRGLIFFYLFLVIFYFQLKAQTIMIQGKVTASRFSVKEALVTFIDDVDTTKKFSTITDNLGNYQIGVTTSIESNKNNLPADFELAQNYPNPFSSSTAIPYNIKKQSDIKVTIYDILGREVRKFTIGLQTAGLHKIFWDGRNSFGQRAANGVYLYKLQAGGESQVKKMILNSGGKNFLSLQQANLSPILKASQEIEEFSYEKNFTVRIENTDNTSPIIIAKQFDNIQVKNDTTINFSVDYLTSATIDLDSVHQYIRGFGAANILQWRPDMTDSEIETAFGTGYGQLGFTILRLRIQPQSDLWYTNLPTAKKAHDMGVLVFASPWDPPAYMLDPEAETNRLRYDMYDEYAAHLDSFNTFMTNNGVPLYAISVQNEPDWDGGWTQWTAEEMVTFMRENAPAIGTRVMAPESFQFRRPFSDAILNDSLANAHLDIVGGHIYGGGLGSYPLAEEKGKEIWMTEHTTDTDYSGNLWPLALDVGTDIHDVMSSGWNAYVWWYIVRYYGPISDGETAGDIKGTVTKRGYIMSQYSRFIRPGDYRVNCAVLPFQMNVYISAYKDSLSSKAVIVAVNTNSTPEDVAFNIQNGTMNTFTTYTTSEFKSVTPSEDININDNNFIFNLEASSITTFVLKP